MRGQLLKRIIFWSRWLQAPLYLGLIIAQGAYVYKFMIELYHLIVSVKNLDESQIMLSVLGLIDVVMIANLLIMVIIGGYQIFVSNLHIKGHPDQPEWLDHVNSGTIKIKLSMALIGISSIHLLKSFINASTMSPRAIMWQVFIHLVFVISTLALAYTDRVILKNANLVKKHE
jgi:uncharacterized protein (TIGR00645 family)